MATKPKVAGGDAVRPTTRGRGEKVVPVARKKATTKTAASKTSKSANAGARKTATAAKTAPVRKARTRVNGTRPVLTSAERQRVISEAAYLISCRRDPAMGTPETDWIHAEVVIDMIFDTRK